MKLRWNNTTKLALVTFLANLYFYNHIGTLYQQSRGLDLLQVSSITSIIIITIFLSEVPTGIIADKIGRKLSVVTSLALMALGEWVYLFASSYFTFVLIAILAGVGFAFLSGANEALIYDSLKGENKEKQMKKAWGIIGGANQMAFFVAPLVGGLLVSNLVLAEFKRVILLTAISVTCALLLSLSLKEPESEYHHPEEGPLHILKLGIKELWGSDILKRILLISTFTATFSGLLVGLYQPHFESNNVPALWMGIALALGGIVAGAAQAFAYKFEDLVGKSLALVILSLFPGFLFIALGLARVPLALVPIFVLTYGFADAKNPLMSSYKNSLIQKHTRATVLSLINMMSSLYIASVGLIIGLIANRSVAAALVTVGAIVVFATLVLRVDRLPSQVSSQTDLQ
jgi:MFS family permease